MGPPRRTLAGTTSGPIYGRMSRRDGPSYGEQTRSESGVQRRSNACANENVKRSEDEGIDAIKDKETYIKKGPYVSGVDGRHAARVCSLRGEDGPREEGRGLNDGSGLSGLIFDAYRCPPGRPSVCRRPQQLAERTRPRLRRRRPDPDR